MMPLQHTLQDMLVLDAPHLTQAVTALVLTVVMLVAWPRVGLGGGMRLRLVLAGGLLAASSVVAPGPLATVLWALPVLLLWTGRSGVALLVPALAVPLAWLLADRAPALASGLMVLGVLARMAVVPFHGWWLRALYTPARPVALLVWIVHPALLAIQALGQGAAQGTGGPALAQGVPDALAVAGVVAALWASVLALVQGQMWRLLGLLAVSHAGMQLAGAMAFNATAETGALLLAGGKGVGLVALALCVAAVKARTGTATLEQLGGLHRTMPRMTGLMLFAGVMAAGFPGSLAFVGEDLLMHGVFEVHPLVTLGVLGATALNGMAVFRAWMRVCLGSGPMPGFEVPPGRDLKARELMGVGLCVALLLSQGVMPWLSVQARMVPGIPDGPAESDSGLPATGATP